MGKKIELAYGLLHAGEGDADSAPSPGMDEIVRRVTGRRLPLTSQVESEVLQKLEGELREGNLDVVWGIEQRCSPALEWLQSAGIGFDLPTWMRLAEETAGEQQVLRERMDAAAPPSPNAALGLGWEWSQEQATILRVFRLLGIDLPDLRSPSLLASGHPLGELLCTYRKISNRVTNYGANWAGHVRGGRLYAPYRQLGAATGRMSCGHPNVQGVLRDPRYRACFVAPPGRMLVKADYSQAELRIAAALAGDATMLAHYNAGGDLHTLTARLLTGRQDVSRDDRQRAKALNFGMLFGMGPTTLQEYALDGYGVALSLEEAQRYRNEFQRCYRDLTAWQKRQEREHPRETRTRTGRRRRLDPNDPKVFTKRLNSPVQGTGADAIKLALALLWETRLACPDAVPVLVCHDEIVVECDGGNVEAVVAWVRQMMGDALYCLIQPVPVIVDAKWGPTWAMD